MISLILCFMWYSLAYFFWIVSYVSCNLFYIFLCSLIFSWSCIRFILLLITWFLFFNDFMISITLLLAFSCRIYNIFIWCRASMLLFFSPYYPLKTIIKNIIIFFIHILLIIIVIITWKIVHIKIYILKKSLACLISLLMLFIFFIELFFYLCFNLFYFPYFITFISVTALLII